MLLLGEEKTQTVSIAFLHNLTVPFWASFLPQDTSRTAGLKSFCLPVHVCMRVGGNGGWVGGAAGWTKC